MVSLGRYGVNIMDTSRCGVNMVGTNKCGSIWWIQVGVGQYGGYK